MSVHPSDGQYGSGKRKSGIGVGSLLDGMRQRANPRDNNDERYGTTMDIT